MRGPNAERLGEKEKRGAYWSKGTARRLPEALFAQIVLAYYSQTKRNLKSLNKKRAASVRQPFFISGEPGLVYTFR